MLQLIPTAAWIGEDADGKPEAFLAVSRRDLPDGQPLDDLLGSAIQSDDAFYILPTDGYFLIAPAPERIALYATTESGDDLYLLECSVPPDWLALAKKHQSFVWMLTDDSTAYASKPPSRDEIVAGYESGDIDLMVPWLFRGFDELAALESCETCGSHDVATIVQQDYYAVRCNACNKDVAGANWWVVAKRLSGELRATIDGQNVAQGSARAIAQAVSDASQSSQVRLTQ